MGRLTGSNPNCLGHDDRTNKRAYEGHRYAVSSEQCRPAPAIVLATREFFVCWELHQLLHDALSIIVDACEVLCRAAFLVKHVDAQLLIIGSSRAESRVDDVIETRDAKQPSSGHPIKTGHGNHWLAITAPQVPIEAAVNATCPEILADAP